MDGPVTVIANLSDAPIVFPLESGRELLGQFSHVQSGDGAVTLAPDAVALVG
jgi:hypothetical protein